MKQAQPASRWLRALYLIPDPVDYPAYLILVAVTGLVSAMLFVNGIYGLSKTRMLRQFPASRRRNRREAGVHVQKSTWDKTLDTGSFDLDDW